MMLRFLNLTSRVTCYLSSFSDVSRLGGFPVAHVAKRFIGIDGRVTNEDRRWWLIHLECCPDVNLGTFVAWLDCCGTHTTKKLIERNIWTIEQVASLNSDQVDELKFKDMCLKMDIVWEHARTIFQPLKQRSLDGGVEHNLKDQIQEIRKKRELSRLREQVINEREELAKNREATLRSLREKIEKKKKELFEKQRQQSSKDMLSTGNLEEIARSPKNIVGRAIGSSVKSTSGNLKDPSK